MQYHLLNCASICAIFLPALAATRRRLIEPSAGPIWLEAGFGVGDMTSPIRTTPRFRALVRPVREPEEMAWHQIRLLPAHLVWKSRVEC